MYPLGIKKDISSEKQIPTQLNSTHKTATEDINNIDAHKYILTTVSFFIFN